MSEAISPRYTRDGAICSQIEEKKLSHIMGTAPIQEIASKRLRFPSLLWLLSTLIITSETQKSVVFTCI